MKKNNILSFILLISILSFSVSTQAQNNNEIVTFQTSAQQILIKFNAGYANVSMTIKGPNGLYINELMGQASEAIVLDDVASLSDGLYRYEFTATASNSKRSNRTQPSYKSTLNNGRTTSNIRRASTAGSVQSASQSGHFRIKNGAVIMDNNENDTMVLTGEAQ